MFFLWQLSILQQYQVQQDRSVCTKCCNCSNLKQIISPFLTKYKVLASSAMNAFFSKILCQIMSLLNYVAQADVHQTTCFGDATGCCDHRSYTVRALLSLFHLCHLIFQGATGCRIIYGENMFFKSYHSVLLSFEMYIIIAVRVCFSRSRRCFQPRALNFSEIGLEIERYLEKMYT